MSDNYVQREETIGNIRFVCCNNLHFMPEVDMGYYHAGVVDPPYGFEADKLNMGTTAAQRAAMKLARGKYTKESWDSKIPPKEYFEQIRRVTRKQIIWGGNYFLDYLGATDCMMLWDKEQGDLTFDDFEIAWTNLDCKCMVCKRSRVKDAKHEKIHQTQKPVYLYRWIFSKLFKYGYLKKGQRVLDTHGGSHNIAIAAYEFGLHLTVLEISMEHHLNGIENFKNKTRQGVFDYDC